MAEKTKTQQIAEDLTSSHAERSRYFEQLRRNDLTDEQRTELLKGYAAASKTFDDARAKAITAGRPS